MELSAEEFADIIDSLQCQLPAPKQAEQRRSQRVRRRIGINIIPIKNGMCAEPVSVLIRDVSVRGIGLLYDREMTPAAQFVLRLPRPEQPSLCILCTVMHSQPAGSELFAIGAEFTCVTNDPAPIDCAEVERIQHGILR